MFGLSNYESRVYLALLSSGIRTAKEISDESKIPIGRIYDVLNSLEDKGLADKQESRPKKFAAKEPKNAINNLLSMKKTDFLSLTEKAVVIEEKLCHLHTEKPDESLFWSVALGQKAISRYIEKISEAEKKLQLIINFRVAARIPQKDVIKNLINTLKILSINGVSIRILISGVKPRSLEEEYLNSIGLFFEILDRVEIKHTRITTTAFDIIDDEKVLLKVMNPVKPDEFLAWIFVWQKKFAMELKPKFRELWKNATELKIKIS
ncbi:MAG: TrmB family transcriptional regulator [Candidatus Hodarchaeales archaeon]|jgi:sugar-specific transcriptional regulator TrmB